MSVNTSNIASALSVNASTSSSSSFNALGSSCGSANSNDKDKESLWYFTADQLINSPSRRHGIDIDQELSYRQMTAYLIQEMGQRLQVSQLCINTAIVYMHRFYAFHSFTHFHRNGIAAASLFLAAKVEEQPRKLEHVIKAANKCLNQPTSSTTDNYYLEQAQDLVFNENVLLQTLGFDVAIDHPHTHVVKTCHLVKACKDLAQTSYFLASNSLHLTSMCLQYKPTVVACFCIYLACKWSRWEIPQSTEGKHWFHYVDKTVTMDLLKQLTDEFIAIYEKSPARLKSKLNSIKALAQGASNRVVNKDKKGTPEEWKMVDMMKMYHSSINTSDTNNVNALTSNSFPASTPIDQQPQQQHQQNVQTALLPPPSNHSHQQIRRPESHSSQHRSHHSSSTSHHHSKQAFSTNDVPDHKASSSHKHYSSSASRPSRDHVQPTQNPSAAPPLLPPSSSAGASRGNLLASNSNSSRSVMSGGVTTQKLSSQSQETSFHKSRDRGGPPAILNSSSAFPSVHKLPQKPDTGRIGSKEHMNRVLSEQNKASNSKVFAPANVSQGGNNQLLSGTEISRNLIHQQHQRIHSSSGFNQPTMPRTSNSSSNSKHDPAMSVQMQSTAHKHPLSLDSQFSTLSSEQLQPSLSLYTGATGTALPPYSNTSKASEATLSGGGDLMDTDPTSQAYSSFLPMHGGFKPQTQQQTKISMFSPEWNEKMPQQQQNTSSSGSNSNNKPNAASTSALNYRMHSSSSSNLDSPKKIDRERNSNTPTKKERNRISYAGIDIAHQSSAATTTRPNIASQSTQKLQIQKKTDISNSNTAVLAGTSANAFSSIKRPNDNATVKHEDDLVRDSKMRKIDSVASTSIMGGVQSFTDPNKLQVVNGIETNPDLVRTLLKESLCTTNALIKNETPASIQTQSTITNSFQPTLQLLDPAVKVKEDKTLPQSIEMDDTVAGSKTEKKKKKDKHKHKEKDKSKDREERKKHKKDKERHKDRESDYSEPVKIKISKDKLENTSSMTGGVSEPLGFKIKIPKERIISDLGCGGTGGSSNYGNISGDISNSAAPPPALKIKISKDKLENYSSGSSTSIDPTSFSNLHNQTGSMSNNIYGNSSSGALGSSSNSKKKDRERDRDREKEKKRNSLEYAKLNSNGSGAPAIGNASIIQTSTSSTKNSSSSKIQLYNNNMSQLFGESNDDEDDDDDKTIYQKTKKPSLLKTANSTLSASAQNYHIPIKQNIDKSSNSDGNYNIQQQQHQQQYLAHQLANQQRQIYQKK